VIEGKYLERGPCMIGVSALIIDTYANKASQRCSAQAGRRVLAE